MSEYLSKLINLSSFKGKFIIFYHKEVNIITKQSFYLLLYGLHLQKLKQINIRNPMDVGFIIAYLLLQYNHCDL